MQPSTPKSGSKALGSSADETLMKLWNARMKTKKKRRKRNLALNIFRVWGERLPYPSLPEKYGKFLVVKS
ncbi:hypothetical protein J6590_001032 [Homalodisca vitripennis]|nr:hypothetical protein J6590_001032 [Homalodisca vitripennis]